MEAEAAECPDDATLLALVEGRLGADALPELDTHLDRCELCREVVAHLGSGPRPKRADTSREDRVGRYLVLEPLGEGAMGVVLRAFDPELERQVALKLLHPGREGVKSRARLVREAQAMVRLSHPNVIAVHDVGARESDVYVAMELARGPNLREWLKEPRARGEILRVFRAAGEGLAAAHAAGLVHRDFKPENVILTEGGVPKVGDFGLASAEGEAPDEVTDGSLLDASLTRTGALLGTPAYMSPEQLDGAAADARSDQFAFCVALHEALTGARPFSGRTLDALRESIASRRVRAHGHVARAIERGLAPDPSDRFEDMRALLRALEPPRLSRRTLALSAAAALAVGGLLYAAAPDTPDPCATSGAALDHVWTASARARVPAAAARLIEPWAARWAAERVAACEATHVAHEQSPERMDRRMACLDRQRGALEVVLARVADDEARAVDVVETLPAPESCASDARVAPPAPEDEAAVAALRRRVDEGRVSLAAAAYTRALTQADALVADAARLGYAPVTAEAGLLRAAALRALARFDDADAAAEAAQLEAEAAGDDRGAAEGWLERVRIAGARGRFSAARTWTRHAWAAHTRAGAPADLQEELLHVRGVIRTSLGAIADAETDLRAALELAEARDAAAPRLASLRSSLGDLLRVDARYEDALAAHREALRLDTRALGPRHPRVGRDHHNVAGVLRRMDRAADAAAHYATALDIARAAYGDDHPEVAITHNSLGLIAFERGDHVEARRRWRRAAEIFDAHAHGDAALTQFNLALLDLAESRPAAAELHIRRAIAIDSARTGPRGKRVGSEHVLLARALHAQGRAEEARAAVATATSIAEELGDPVLAREAREAVLDAPPAAADIAPSRPPAAASPPAGARSATTPPPRRRPPPRRPPVRGPPPRRPLARGPPPRRPPARDPSARPAPERGPLPRRAPVRRLPVRHLRSRLPRLRLALRRPLRRPSPRGLPTRDPPTRGLPTLGPPTLGPPMRRPPTRPPPARRPRPRIAPPDPGRMARAARGSDEERLRRSSACCVSAFERTNAMHRRRFLGATLGSLAFAACGGLRTLAAAQACAAQRTARDIEGPFYVPGAPTRSELVDAPRLRISGRVRDTACRPLPGAVIEVWQADPEGEYDLDGHAFRGVLRADADGAYTLGTVSPGRYRIGATYRPAHIHVKVHATGRPPLTTQLYFPHDPYNDADPWHRASLELRFAPLGCSDPRLQVRHARFDFVV